MTTQKLDGAIDPVSGQPVGASERIREISWTDLPLGCPMPDRSLWDVHPRVYLPIHLSGRERCPYCSTLYVLRDPRPGDAVPAFANAQIEQYYQRALARSTRQANTSLPVTLIAPCAHSGRLS
ncbi:zinc-finger domain-containing protein [Metallibacterium sp.]